MTLDVHSRVARSPDQIFAPVDDEIVLLHSESGKYYWANDVGAEVFAQLAEPIRVSDVCAVLQNRFDVSPERCAEDVLAFLNALEARGLVVVVA